MIVYNEFSTLKVERRQTVPRKYHSNQELMFPDISAPGAVFYRVQFVFMGYHPEDGEFEKSFSGRVKTKNKDEAILKALDLAVEKYPQYFFRYQVGPLIGSGAYLVYRSSDMLHIFVRVSSKEKALALTKGDKCYYIRVTPCPQLFS